MRSVNTELPRKLNPGEEIDRGSFEPAYLQLANILRRQIADGVFRPGDQLPSEAQLVQRYGLSPMTIRRSINLLADQGVILTEQGRGVFVKPVELREAVFDLQGLENLFNLGPGSSVRLLDARVVPADERTGRKLGLQPGAPTIFMRRVYLCDHLPIFYHRAHLIYDPLRPIVEAEMDVTSLQGLFTSAPNTLLKNGTLSIEAALLNEEEASLLKRPLPSAAFLLEHLFFDFDNRPISWGWFVIPGDRLHFTTRVGVTE